MMMQPIENQREFSMKYCPDLEDHVIVMTVGGTNVKNKICLSSHLCPADTKISCGHGQACAGKKDGGAVL